MPMPSLPRLFLYALAAAVLSLALYFVIRGAVMLYELYQFMQWVEEFGE